MSKEMTIDDKLLTLLAKVSYSDSIKEDDYLKQIMENAENGKDGKSLT